MYDIVFNVTFVTLNRLIFDAVDVYLLCPLAHIARGIYVAITPLSILKSKSTNFRKIWYIQVLYDIIKWILNFVSLAA